MNNLIILGAGGFGREVYNWAKQSPQHGKDYIIKGFLDDNENALSNFKYPVKVIGSISDYSPQREDVFICAIGSPGIKRKVCSSIEAKGGTFLNIIHPSAIIGENVSLGIGVVVCPGVKITCDVKVGNHVSININSCVGHDATIGDHCQISCFCDLNGYSVIGNEVFIGGSASVLPGIKVADGVTIGSGALVVKNITQEGVTVVGVPAKKL
jgi:sugar O-acyltransferase (sialic acid O-acetyltransferase NeuD family)